MLRSTKNLHVLLIPLFVVLTFVFVPTKAFAVTGADWRAGRIIDDGIFYNNNDMSVTDIQNFLNSKVTCDTWGSKPSEWGGGTRAQYGASKGYPAPYTCLKDYSQDGKSAAQIIKDAANTYQISTRALIVLLQKEQALVTDEWPWSIQYRSATGYGCPDTAPCDAEYYGFKNQVMKAAYQFRRYASYPSEYRYKPYQNNTIQFNPNAGCGSTNVYIENLATAGLYNYTPYQPNSSALNNLYGSGDSCGAYGNRNFWRLFNDWYGNPVVFFAGSKPSSSSSYAKLPCSISSFDTDTVLRLYHPDTRDFLFTTNRYEACQAVSFGYIFDGPVFKDAGAVAGSIPIYRISNYERHLYTPSLEIRNSYINNLGYKSEGIAFYGFTSQSVSSTPVYGLQSSQTYFITSAAKEADLYQSYGFYNFGITFYAKQLPKQTLAVYRLSNSSHSRLYTPSATERIAAISQFGFRDEGVVAYNSQYPDFDNTPIFRLRGPGGAYFYTHSRVERDLAVINYNYINEGVGWYAPLYTLKPIYRAVNPLNALRIYTNSRIEYDIAMQVYRHTGEGVGWYSK